MYFLNSMRQTSPSSSEIRLELHPIYISKFSLFIREVNPVWDIKHYSDGIGINNT